MNRAEAIEFAKSQQEIFGGKMGEFLEFVENELTQTNTSNALNALDCVDTVSRQAAIDEMSNMYHAAEKWLQEAEDDTIKARAESCMATLVEMKLRVEKLPSAERRGKWIYPTDIIGFGRCGNCKALWDIGLIRNKFFRYCPRCGAEMITDKDDTQ